MPKLAKLPDPQAERLAEVEKQLCNLINVMESLGREIAGLREWVETAVNRPWALAAGAPKGRDDSEIPF